MSYNLTYKEELTIMTIANVVVWIIVYFLNPIIANFIVIIYDLVISFFYHGFNIHLFDFLLDSNFWEITLWIIVFVITIQDYRKLGKKYHERKIHD